MKYQNKTFSVFMGGSENYRNNYDQINWNRSEQCPLCNKQLSLLGLKDKATGKNKYWCPNCYKEIIL
jgi:formamidopyrimidine-DNA glycosylase